MPIIFQILMYLSPVIYPVAFYPADFAHILLLNPTASLMAILQWSLFGAEIDLAYSLIIICFWFSLLSWISGFVYRLGSKHFTKTLKMNKIKVGCHMTNYLGISMDFRDKGAPSGKMEPKLFLCARWNKFRG